MLDFDKDIEIISEQESGVETGSTSGYVRYEVMRQHNWSSQYEAFHLF